MTTNKSSQIATEPNAINVRVDQDFNLYPDYIYDKLEDGAKIGMHIVNYLHSILANHSKFKNPQSVKILQKAMQEKRK